MKIIFVLLTIVALVGLKVTAGDSSDAPGSAPSDFKPTLKSEDHDQPVFTSPTNDIPPDTHRTQTNALPETPNWPTTNLPPMTNWPATNLPATTNPPPLLPPASINRGFLHSPGKIGRIAFQVKDADIKDRDLRVLEIMV